MPLPSTIAGIVGAILGVRRKKLKEFVENTNLHCGAMLLGLDGYISEFIRLFKFPKESITTILKKLSDPKENKKLMPIYKSISLFKPKYKLAISLNNKTIYEELLERLKTYNFVYDIYGGNDYNFVEWIGEIKEAKVMKKKRGWGYCPVELFSSIGSGYSAVVSSDIVVANIKKKFVFVYGAEVHLKGESWVVDDGESIIFIYEAKPFIVSIR